MEGEDSQLEQFEISVAVGAALQEFDLVIDPFQGTSGDRGGVPGQEAAAMAAQGVGELLQEANAAGCGPGAPVGEEAGGGLVAPLLPELPQEELDKLSSRCWCCRSSSMRHRMCQRGIGLLRNG